MARSLKVISVLTQYCDKWISIYCSVDLRPQKRETKRCTFNVSASCFSFEQLSGFYPIIQEKSTKKMK